MSAAVEPRPIFWGSIGMDSFSHSMGLQQRRVIALRRNERK